jgi:DNA modification methylase
MPDLSVRTISLRDANAFVAEHHRHHRPVVGHKFSLSVVDEAGTVCGVVIVGRPVNRVLDTGDTLEVNRLCTPSEGAKKNAASMLYAAARRSAKELGYRRLTTYIRAEEDGTSLKAAGWKLVDGNVSPSDWVSRPLPDGRERDEPMGGIKTRWEATLTEQHPSKAWKNRIVSAEDVAPDQLLANPANWRVHPKFQQEAMAAALSEVGWIQRVVVNLTTGHVIDGHLRVALAISRGEQSVPVSYVKLSPDEERLALATFDPLSSLAVADGSILQSLLADVSPFVDDAALNKLLHDLGDGSLLPVGDSPGLAALIPDERAPRPPLSRDEGEHLDEIGQEIEQQEPAVLQALRERWGTAVGQVWLIPSGTVPGKRHLLVVGDCLEPSVIDLAKTYLPEQGAVVVTSPPYGMGQGYEASYEKLNSFKKRGPRDHRGPDQWGGRPTDEGIKAWQKLIWDFAGKWSKVVRAAAINLADHTVAPQPGYGRHTYADLVAACATAQWPYVATRMWVKPPMLGNNPYWLKSYKPIPEFEYVGFFADLDAFPVVAPADRVPQAEEWRYRSRWEFGTVASQQLAKGFHPAAFPVELPRRCILLFTDAGGTVVDPFLGSGTTLIAAEALGRLCVGVELDPLYAAMTLERCTRSGIVPEKVKEQADATEAPVLRA